MTSAGTNPSGAAHCVRDALRFGIAQLESAGTPSAALAAELLLMHALGRDRAWIYAHPEGILSPDEVARYEALISKRAAGTPTQYLTGKQEFWGLEFEVTPAVLIPRPETEHIVEVVLARLGEKRRGDELQIADIGTGSGCIAVALAKELPKAKIYATDISDAALEVAKRNAARHAIGDQIHFISCSLLDGVAEPAEFDVIASNPPYVALRDAGFLQKEIREHEPKIALFAGENGLDVYSPLIQQASNRLKRGGILALELGFGMFEAVSDLLDATAGWTQVSATMDLAAIPRVLSCRKA
jgi:release factor glutamine methyltransferase